jgi:hypothetical protein
MWKLEAETPDRKVRHWYRKGPVHYCQETVVFILVLWMRRLNFLKIKLNRLRLIWHKERSRLTVTVTMKVTKVTVTTKVTELSNRHYQSDRSDRHCSIDQSDRHRKSDQTDRNGQDDRGDEYTLLDETDYGSDFSSEVANTESPEIVVSQNNVMPKTQLVDNNDGNNVGRISTQTQNEILSDRPVAASSQGEVKGHQMSSHNRTTHADQLTLCQLVNGCWIPVDKESADHRRIKTVSERSVNNDQKKYASKTQHKQILTLPNNDVTETSRSERDLELWKECDILSIQGNCSSVSRYAAARTARDISISENRDELVHTKVGPTKQSGSLHSLYKNVHEESNKNATENIKTAQAGAVEAGSFIKFGSQYYFLQPVSTKHTSTIPVTLPSSIRDETKCANVHLGQLLAVEKADQKATTAETAVEVETRKTEASVDVLDRTISIPSEGSEE